MQKPIKLIPAIKKAVSVSFRDENLGYLAKASLVMMLVMASISIVFMVLQLFSMPRATTIYNNYGTGLSSSQNKLRVETTAIEEPRASLPLITIVISIVSFLVYFVLMFWFGCFSILLILAVYRGQRTPIKDLALSSLYKTPKFAVFSAVQMIIIFLASLLLIIPGIMLMIKFLFAPFILLEDNCGIIEALKRSSAITKGYGFNLFFKGVGYFFVMILCLIPIIVLAYGLGFLGSFLINAVSISSMLVIMDDIKTLKTPAAPATSSIAL